MRIKGRPPNVQTNVHRSVQSILSNQQQIKQKGDLLLRTERPPSQRLNCSDSFPPFTFIFAPHPNQYIKARLAPQSPFPTFQEILLCMPHSHHLPLLASSQKCTHTQSSRFLMDIITIHCLINLIPMILRLQMIRNHTLKIAASQMSSPRIYLAPSLAHPLSYHLYHNPCHTTLVPHHPKNSAFLQRSPLHLRLHPLLRLHQLPLTMAPTICCMHRH